MSCPVYYNLLVCCCRCSLWSCSAGRASCGCRSGTLRTRTKWRRRSFASWCRPSWPGNRRCRALLNGKTWRLFIKGHVCRRRLLPIMYRILAPLWVHILNGWCYVPENPGRFFRKKLCPRITGTLFSSKRLCPRFSGMLFSAKRYVPEYC